MHLARLIAVAGAMACSGRTPVMTALEPDATSLIVTVAPASPTADSVAVRALVTVRNPTAATLYLGPPLGSCCGLEYLDGDSWRPAREGLEIVAVGGALVPMELPASAELRLEAKISGLRGKAIAQTHWVGPLSGRYRFVTHAYRRWEPVEQKPTVVFVSEPFELKVSAPARSPNP